MLLAPLRHAQIVVAVAVALAALVCPAAAERVIQSKSLNTCMDNSKFSASLFDIAYTPGNNTVAFTISGISEISGYVNAELRFYAYGYKAVQQTLDPCKYDGMSGFCPMNAADFKLTSNFQLGDDVSSNIPNIAYNIPDIDGVVQVRIITRDSNEQIACLEAELSNGKTVYQKAIGWAIGFIPLIGLASAAAASEMGRDNSAARVASYALSLLGFYQAQSYVGMTAVDMPPIADSWTQNLAWSMGVARVGFLQRLATWYQRATGGTPSTILSTLQSVSVDVEKRMVKRAAALARRAVKLMARTNNESAAASVSQSITVKGIERVGFRAKVELTNIFMMSYELFVALMILTLLVVLMYRGVLEVLGKTGRIKPDRFQEFRTNWRLVMKGILLRVFLAGFPAMVVMCFWELTHRDSAGEVVIAIITILTMLGTLAWAAFRVISVAQTSIRMHKNPAYTLYSDPRCLNKWGFLYVQYRAASYFFVAPMLIFILVKGMFIAFAQKSGVTQAAALCVLDLAMLIALCVLMPYMDKRLNIFNITISVLNFLNAAFLLVFAKVNNLSLATGVMGVVFFVYNAAATLVFIIVVFVSSYYALFVKPKEGGHYESIRDRGSFVGATQTPSTMELKPVGSPVPDAEHEPKHGHH